MNLHIFLTTKRLISQLYNSYNTIGWFYFIIFIIIFIDSNHIASDATYKFIFQGFPILQIGTTDFNRQYHPYGVMVTKHENEEDYEYMFNALKRIVKEIHQIDFEPTILLADTAGAITNGFSNVFKLTHRVFCWSHVKRNIDAKLNSVLDKANNFTYF